MWRRCVTDTRPAVVDIADIISAIFARPADPPQDDDAEAVQRQIRPATPNEMADIEALAMRTALLQDEVRALMGKKAQELRNLQQQLLDRMLNHGIPELHIAGRPAIEVVLRKERRASKKSITAALTKELGDPKKAAAEATKLWNSIPQVDKESLVIPDVAQPDIESPY